jgi:hypothetical protein
MNIWTCYYILAPIFGTVCFMVGAAVLFAVSLGRWRVRRWPRFGKLQRQDLEPFRTTIGSHTYFSADAALFLGLGIFVIAILVAALYFGITRFAHAPSVG